MPIHEEYSLVRYDPRQGLLSRRAEGSGRPASIRTSASSYPHENTLPASTAAGSLQRSRPHLIYSLQRTLEASAGGAIGQRVDIFV
jgi:hypothetical protein